jgi:hypothetical protein
MSGANLRSSYLKSKESLMSEDHQAFLAVAPPASPRFGQAFTFCGIPLPKMNTMGKK